ncbi:MAG: hypothetical protein DGJ47_000692 [Rickettsiaceae bacterium]
MKSWLLWWYDFQKLCILNTSHRHRCIGIQCCTASLAFGLGGNMRRNYDFLLLRKQQPCFCFGQQQTIHMLFGSFFVISEKFVYFNDRYILKIVRYSPALQLLSNELREVTIPSRYIEITFKRFSNPCFSLRSPSINVTAQLLHLYLCAPSLFLPFFVIYYGTVNKILVICY